MAIKFIIYIKTIPPLLTPATSVKSTPDPERAVEMTHAPLGLPNSTIIKPILTGGLPKTLYALGLPCCVISHYVTQLT